MINRLAKLFALTAASIPCAGFAAMPDTAIHEDGVTPRSVVLNLSRMVSDDELSGMRGGFFTAAGAQFDFGASVQTLVNGKLALQTNLQWTPAGAVTQQLQGLGTQIQAQVASQVADNLAKAGIATPAAAMQTTAAVIADSTTPNSAATPMPATQTASNASTGSGSSASAPAAAAPAATLAANTPAAGAPAASTAAPAASVPAGASTSTASAAPVTISVPTSGDVPKLLTGVQIPSATGGSTTVFANIGGGSIQNVILNSASGQDITQNTNVTLTVYNFAAWQQSVAQHMLSARLASDMLAASGLSAGH